MTPKAPIKSVNITLVIPEDLAAELRARAAADGRSMSNLYVRIVREWLCEQGRVSEEAAR